MTKMKHRSGSALRTLLVVLAVLAAVPMLMIGLSLLYWQAESVTAQDTRRAAEFREQQSIQAVPPTPALVPATEHVVGDVRPEPATVYRPVTETEYREQRVTIAVPERDPQTGQTVMKPREIVRQVPVTTQRWIKESQSVVHDPNITQLANQLRTMDEADENRQTKLNQLRQRLELEFAQMHDNQAKEIEQTSERLEALKQLHQQRGQNKDRIVQRRIDELLGKTDVTQWNAPNLQSNSPPRPANLLGPPRAYGTTDSVAPMPRTYGPVIQPDRASPIDVAPDAIRGILITPNRQVAQPPAPLSSARKNSTPTNQDSLLNRPAVSTFRSAAEPPTVDPALPPNSYQQRQPTAQLGQSLPQPPVRIAMFSVGELFQLARDSADALAALADAEVDYERLRKLNDKGAVSSTELRIAKSKLEKLQRNVELNEYQLEAISESFDRNLKFAESSLEHTTETLKLVQEGYKQGVESVKTRIEAEFAADKARKALDDATANIKQLSQAKGMIEKARKKVASQAESDKADGPDRSEEKAVDAGSL